MREILFKGKNGNEWIQGDLSTLSCDVFGKKIEVGIKPSEDIRVLAVIPETICQYTGLKDKNGVKVFENDIFMENTDFNEKYVITWSESDCQFVGLKMKDNFNTLPISQLIDNGYLIGNIHDGVNHE